MTLSLIVVIESYAAFGIGDMPSRLRRNSIDPENTLQQTPVSISGEFLTVKGWWESVDFGEARWDHIRSVYTEPRTPAKWGPNRNGQ
jgi:hypothetical protein